MMQTHSNFEKYLGYLNEIVNREKMERFYNLRLPTFQFFKAINKYGQEVLSKSVVDVVGLEKLENALPVLTELKNEISELKSSNLSVLYKSTINQITDYIIYEMSISEVDDMYRQFFDLLRENKQALINEKKIKQAEEKQRQAEEAERIAAKKKKEKYNQLVQEKNSASTEVHFYHLTIEFSSMNGYENSEKLAKECDDKYRILKKLREEKEEQQKREEKERIEKKNQELKPIRERIAKYQGCISTGFNHTVGLKANGRVISIGSNWASVHKEVGQCFTSGWRNIVAVSANSYCTVGLKADGTVVAIGENDYGQCNTNDWHNIVAISAGSFHTVGLKADGTVVVIGNNSDGKYNTNDWRDIVAISAGLFFTVGLKSDGTVVVTGNDFNTSGWRDIVAVSATNSNIVGLKSDGTVVAIGDNSWGVCNTNELKDIVAISSLSNTVGLKADGTVVVVGRNDFGQCNTSSWHDIVAISSGNNYTVGLKADGTVVAVGINEHGECNVSDWRNIGPVDKERLKKGGCFIATACYGDYHAPEVLVLRAYRDEQLLTHWLGRAFVKFYYFVSPPLARLIEKSDKAKDFIRKYFLNHIIKRIKREY